MNRSNNITVRHTQSFQFLEIFDFSDCDIICLPAEPSIYKANETEGEWYLSD